MLRRLPTSLALRTDLLDDVAESLDILARRVVHASYPMVRGYNHRLVMVLASCPSLRFGVMLVVVGHYDLCRGAGSLTHI